MTSHDAMVGVLDVLDHDDERSTRRRGREQLADLVGNGRVGRAPRRRRRAGVTAASPPATARAAGANATVVRGRRARRAVPRSIAIHGAYGVWNADGATAAHDVRRATTSRIEHAAATRATSCRCPRRPTTVTMRASPRRLASSICSSRRSSATRPTNRSIAGRGGSATPSAMASARARVLRLRLHRAPCRRDERVETVAMLGRRRDADRDRRDVRAPREAIRQLRAHAAGDA